jgi:hypothetical protein
MLVSLRADSINDGDEARIKDGFEDKRMRFAQSDLIGFF